METGQTSSMWIKCSWWSQNRIKYGRPLDILVYCIFHRFWEQWLEHEVLVEREMNQQIWWKRNRTSLRLQKPQTDIPISYFWFLPRALALLKIPINNPVVEFISKSMCAFLGLFNKARSASTMSRHERSEMFLVRFGSWFWLDIVGLLFTEANLVVLLCTGVCTIQNLSSSRVSLK